MLAGIEVGGTKIVCAVGPQPGTILRRRTIPTGQPSAAIDEVLGFLRAAPAGEAPLRGVGIGSFGPLDLNPASTGFGAMTRTPKPGWSGVNLRLALAEALGCPVAIDTDVNAAGIAEAALGAGRGLESVAYITVGTGIGGGLIVGGRPLHGLTHPEMGHMRPRRRPDDDFAGICPFHGDCVEGMASGTAILARAGRNLSDLAESDPLWALLGDYLGQLCATLVLIGSPQRIVMGGGVMHANPRLFGLVRAAARACLGGYVQAEAVAGAIDRFIVAPDLGQESGVIGALMLAGGVQVSCTR
jgi:fructokinase